MTPAPLDPIPILAHLGLHNPETVSPVIGGRDTAIWRVEQGADTYALRVFRAEQAPVVEYEVAAMRAAEAGGVPVPMLHGLAAWQDRPAMLLSWCAGHTLLAELQRHPQRAYDMGVLSGEMLARIHHAPLPATARSWLSGSGQVEPRLHKRLMETATQERLLHMDVHPLNLLTDGERITAVLDWTNALTGDPRADLARSISLLRLDAEDLPPHERALVRPYERGLRHGYGSVEQLAPYLVWAGTFMLDDVRQRLESKPAQRRRIERWRTTWGRLSGTS